MDKAFSTTPGLLTAWQNGRDVQPSAIRAASHPKFSPLSRDKCRTVNGLRQTGLPSI